jgi:hypothetical protein
MLENRRTRAKYVRARRRATTNAGATAAATVACDRLTLLGLPTAAPDRGVKPAS